jgi:hypothetical protein
MKQLSTAVTDLQVCQRSLKLREDFITDQKMAGPPPESAWWQEPTFVVGGVVVSLSFGLAVGLLVGARH